jgi:hypothetical protein
MSVQARGAGLCRITIEAATRADVQAGIDLIMGGMAQGDGYAEFEHPHSHPHDAGCCVSTGTVLIMGIAVTKESKE